MAGLFTGSKKESTEHKFRDFIDEFNATKTKELEANGEVYESHYEPNIWLRDYNNDIETPLIPVRVQGKIPKWLNGTFIRTGPGKMSFGDTQFKHIFDFSAVIHRFKIENGSCLYQSKLLKSDSYKKNLAAQRIVVSEFGTAAVPDPCKTIFDKFSSVFTKTDPTDNCVVAVYPYGDEIYTMTEASIMQQIDPATLETLKAENVTKYVEVVHQTAHPHVMADGTVYNIGISVTSSGPKYAIFSFPPSKEGSILEGGKIECQVPVRWTLHPCYIHSFGITNNYFIIIEQPLAISIPEMYIKKFKSESFASSLTWYDDYDTVVYVIHKQDKSIKRYFIEPFFFFHTINQYEDDKSNIILDICAYKDGSVVNCMYVDAMKGSKLNHEYGTLFRSRPIRLTLPLEGTESKTEVVPEILCELGCELPRINYESYVGVSYKYFYAISTDWDNGNPGMIIKVDTLNKTYKTWAEEGLFPGEPVFVSKPEPQDEDDGVVLSALLSKDELNKVTLLVLDAKSMTELGRAVFESPDPVPNCFHGWFLP